MIYLAWEITRARYINNGIGWYISLEKLLERDISKMGLVDISRSRNFSSKIYWKWDWLIYLAREITWARYIKNGIGWYISLKKLLEQDISKMELADISRTRNYLSEIYQKWNWLIYLAQVITWARYINIGIGIYILLKLFLERDKSKIRLFDVSRSSNYSSKICQKWNRLICLAREITRARYIEDGIGWYISLEKYLDREICKNQLKKIQIILNISNLILTIF